MGVGVGVMVGAILGAIAALELTFCKYQLSVNRIAEMNDWKGLRTA
jgi:hypothetical protein